MKKKYVCPVLKVIVLSPQLMKGTSFDVKVDKKNEQLINPEEADSRQRRRSWDDDLDF